MSQVGEIFDLPVQGNVKEHWGAAVAAVRDEIDRTGPYDAVQIVGGDSLVPYAALLNPAYGVDEYYDPIIYTDDFYGDSSGDGLPDIPVARLPDGASARLIDNQFARPARAAPKPGSSVSYSMVGKGGGFSRDVQVLHSAMAGAEIYWAPPHRCPENPVSLRRPAFAHFLLHGGCADTGVWAGEDAQGRQFPAFEAGDARPAGLVVTESCYGGWLVERDYTSETTETWSTPAWSYLYEEEVLRYDGKPRSPSNSIALSFLASATDAFIGATAINYSEFAPDFARRIYLSVQSGSDPLQAFLLAKRDLQGVGSPLVREKVRRHYAYYGLVPVSYWRSPPAPIASLGVTSLVLDCSGSMQAYVNGIQKVEAAKDAARACVDIATGAAAMGSGGRTGLVRFNESAVEVQASTTSADAIKDAISGLSASGSTNLVTAIDAGVQQIEGAGAARDKAMILLSDGVDEEGNSDDDVLAAAQRAGDKGIKVYPIGFGDQSTGLDEDLLRQIAASTGGEYSYADPSSLVSIAGSFLYSQLSSRSDVVVKSQGTVAQGDTAEAGSFEVTSTGDLQAVLYWPGSRLDIKLVDPSGTEVASGYPGLNVVRDTSPAQLFVRDAKQGTWKMFVYGAETSMKDEPFYALASFDPTAAASVAAGGGTGGGGPEIYLLVLGLGVVGGVGWLTMASRIRKPIPVAPATVAARFSLRDEADRSYPLADGLTTVGRSDDNDIVLTEPTVSRRHAVFHVRGANVTVSDLNSTRGTFVNGKRVERAQVRDKDTVGFGDARFMLRASEEGEPGR